MLFTLSNYHFWIKSYTNFCGKVQSGKMPQIGTVFSPEHKTSLQINAKQKIISKEQKGHPKA